MYSLFALAILFGTAFAYECGDAPYTNGCSAWDIVPYKEYFLTECNKHDVCYSCGSVFNFSKNECEEAFLDNLYGLCTNWRCDFWAWVYYNVVYSFGYGYLNTSMSWCTQETWIRELCLPVDWKKNVSGCVPPIQKRNAVHFGNMYSIGKTVRYKCVDGYRNKPKDVVLSTCAENGNWSMADITCLPEAAFGDDIFEFNCTFYKLLREEQNWDDTKQACEELGGHLVYIKSQEEDNFIETEIASLQNYWCHWIGGRRHNGELTWLDGTLVADGYTNYHPGEPNSNNGNEDCLMLWNFGTGIKWNDAHCYSNYCRAICELMLMSN